MNPMGGTTRFFLAAGLSAMVVAIAHAVTPMFELATSANWSTLTMDHWLAVLAASGIDPVGQVPIIALAGLIVWVLPRSVSKRLRNIERLISHVLLGAAAFLLFDMALFFAIQAFADLAPADASWASSSFVAAQAITTGTVWGMTYWFTRDWPSYLSGYRQ